MHDDIGAGLTRITLMSEIAKRHSNKEELAEIADASRQLVNNMNEIIWSIDSEHRSLDHLFAYLREQLHKLLEPSGIEYSIDLPDDTGQIILSNDERRNILLVCKEIVHNSIKHSMAGCIIVKAWLEKNDLHFSIMDNGKGFIITEVTGGNGLKNLQHRLSGLRADFSIESAPGKGVVASFTLPLKSH